MEDFIPDKVDGGFVEGAAVGYLKPEFAPELARFPDIFLYQQTPTHSPRTTPHVAVSPSLATPAQRTEAIARVLEALQDEGKIGGWRDELFPVAQSFEEEPAFLLERAAATLFGIKTYGVHVNGYVNLPDDSQEMWVARRSLTKDSWPGKLDNIAAGGQPHGLSCFENMIKECGEEASIPAELASTARAVGAIGYTALRPAGLRRDVLFCYDLELPLDFIPHPQDGEAEGFVRLPIAEVARLAGTSDEFKDNCNLVVADFLVRHGYLTPDMRGYCEVLRGLRAGDCS